MKPEYFRFMKPWIKELEKPWTDEANFPLEKKYDGKHSYLWLLKELEKTQDLSLLLPLLKVPKKVLPHFQDLLVRRFEWKLRHGQANTLPSYKPMREHVADIKILADIVRHLIAAGASKEEAITEIGEKVLPDWRRESGYNPQKFNRHKLETALAGKHSGPRGLRERRAKKEIMGILANFVRQHIAAGTPKEEAITVIAEKFLPLCWRDLGYDPKTFNRPKLEAELNGAPSGRRQRRNLPSRTYAQTPVKRAAPGRPRPRP